MADDLADLFPNLASSLENWDGTQPSADDALTRDPEHGGVTDEQIEAELRRMGALRAPLNPLISGQQPPISPEFRSGSGRMAPPTGKAIVEPAQAPEPGEPEEPSDLAEEEVPGIPEEEGAESPETPAPPPPIVSTPPPVTVAGRDYDRAQIEAWAQFDSLVASDADLRNLIGEHLRRRSTGDPIPGVQSPLAPTDLPTLPELPSHYAEDETIAGMYRTLQAQQQLLDRTIRESRQALNQSSSNTQRTYVDITRGAMSEFKQARGLDDPTMDSIMRTVVQTGLANTYMRGVDPVTGETTADPRTGSPDPYKAISRALEVAYFMVPETRQAEIDRGVQDRIDRERKTATRKEKLAGVSGAAGSVPRTQSVPAEPRDRYDAMVEEMRQMQNGSWVGDGTN